MNGTLVAIDVEVYERDHNILLEVGLASIDLQYLWVPNPRSYMTARHWIIREHEGFHNGEFNASLKGVRDYFCFGKSEALPLASIRVAVAALFKTWTKCRRVWVMGHGIQQDLSWCEDSGLVFPHVEIVDIVLADNALRGAQDKRGLVRQMKEHGVEGGFEHNGGNDAAYTLLVGVEMTRRRALADAVDPLGSDGAGEPYLYCDYDHASDLQRVYYTTCTLKHVYKLVLRIIAHKLCTLSQMAQTDDFHYHEEAWRAESSPDKPEHWTHVGPRDTSSIQRGMVTVIRGKVCKVLDVTTQAYGGGQS